MAGVLLVSSCGGTKTVSSTDTENVDNPSPENSSKVDYVDPGALRFEDHTYSDYIHTVQLYPSNEPLEYPIITLGAAQHLELHFDDLGDGLEQYYYRIYHCSSDWKKSDLIEMQYLDGFYSDIVDDYERSFNTLTPYTHYSTQIPNESMRIKISGNYLLVVTEGDDESLPVLSKRFMVVEPLVLVEATVKQSLLSEDRPYKQLVDFNVHYPNFQINNPFRDVKAVVLQNWRWDRAITELKPIFLRDKMLEYRYDQGNDFWAGNEFRQFNISSTRYIDEQVAAIQREGEKLVGYLTPDQKRSLKGYRTFQDINGQYLVRNTQGFNDITESDYVDVHFALDWPSPDENGSFYIYGGLSDWNISQRFKMKYDYDHDAYTCVVPLKQGFYEYEYVFLGDKSDEIDELPVEGSYYETENDYTVLIYYRDFGNDYDQLIGVTKFSTRDRF